VGPGEVQNDKWAGYAVTGKEFTEVTGSWQVPAVDCSVTPNGGASFWVGLNGYSDDYIEATGTSSNCMLGAPYYYAWYEFDPTKGGTINKFSVKPGDVIGAEVKFLAGGTFQVRIHNSRTNKLFVQDLAIPGIPRTSAEWIVEPPLLGPYCADVQPLTDFDLVNFGMDYTGDAGTNEATDSTTSGPIGAFGSNVEEIMMVSCAGILEARPTPLTSDGSSFRVSWDSP
jgi:hypothetical protein